MPKFSFLFLLLAWATVAKATSPDSTAVYESKTNRIGINTFAFQNFLRGTDTLNEKHILQFYLGQDFLYNSALLQNKFTRQDYTANLAHSHEFRPRLFLEEKFNYKQTKASFTTIGSLTEQLRFKARSHENWQLNGAAFAGLRYDARSQRAGSGPEYGGNLNGGYSTPDGSETVSGNLFFSQANVSPRIFQRMLADALYEQRFDAGTQVIIRGEYRRNRNEDFLNNNVQRIQSDTLSAFLTGNYAVSKKLSFRSSNQVALPSRSFLYRPLSESSASQPNSSYRQFEMETMQELLFQADKLQANAQFGYSERNRIYAQTNNNIKDLLQSTTSWAVNATYLLGNRHSITSQSQGELLRVDTPSDENNEDRDEIFYQSKLLFTSRWLPDFRTSFAFVGAYKQYVFIKAKQSSENYTERSLTYEPGFIWAPGRFSWDAHLQLQANYQAYNLISEQLRNRSSRTFNQTHTLRYEATGNLLFQAEYYRRENRLGLLNWENFTESPLDTSTSNTLALFVKKRLSSRHNSYGLRVGYRYFEQQIKGKAGMSKTGQSPMLIYLHQVTRQQGPEVRCEFRTNNGFRLEGGLWLQHSRNFKTYKETSLPYLGSTLSPEELNLAQKNWYPYFDVSLHWAFRR